MYITSYLSYTSSDSKSQNYKTMFAFEMDQKTLEEFYRRAKHLNAITEEQKTHVLFEMVREGLIKNVLETNTTKEQFVEVLSRYFNVLDAQGEKYEPETESKDDSGQAGTIGN